MGHQAQATRWVRISTFTAALALALAGCSGDDGRDGAPGSVVVGGSVTDIHDPQLAAMKLTITGVTISSPPVVRFTAADQNGKPVAGLANANVYFNIAKLVPGTDGNPSQWQNYVNTTQTASAAGAPKPIASAVQATRENNGTLIDYGDGSYAYTFATDITNIACPSPCQDAKGNPLDVSYNASLTHRVAIQLNGVTSQATGTSVLANAIYTFRPSDGATTGLNSREIVKTETCNQCHNRLVAHGGRIDTKFCVTCHNPGTTDPDSGNTVDLKVMVHKIHSGANLPSVQTGGEYAIYGYRGTKYDFSTVHFPQDARNCTKCHDGSDPATPQGGNWATRPSIEACGSCHDNVNFSTGDNHPGGAVTNAECTVCHGENRFAGSVEASHGKPTNLQPSSPWTTAASAKFRFNILSVTNTGQGQFPVVKFSVTDPTAGDAAYDIKTHGAFTAPGSMSLLIGWNNADLNNAGSGTNPAQPISVSVLGTGAANAVDNGDGTYTVTSAKAIPPNVTGSGRAALQGYVAGDTDGDGVYASATRVPVKSVVKDFAITDAAPVARRKVVDVAKCDQCHGVLSLHGSNRTDEPGVCAMCHNPNDTDVNRRPKTGGIPDATLALDSKKEESIDFKRMIHAIHAAAKTNYDGTTGHGFRNNGIVVYGFNSSVNDFSHLRFPGILQDCQTCHLPGTYTLAGMWAEPNASGILASTIDTAPSAVDAASLAAGLVDPDDDLNITPTAAVCSSCHDGGPAKTHMEQQGALFATVQSAITREESCAVCHGPGRDYDVEKVHARR